LAGLLVWVIPPILRWAIFDAVWTGTHRDACLTSPDALAVALRQGAFRAVHVRPLPVEERWRIDLAAILLVIGLIRWPFRARPLQTRECTLLLVVVAGNGSFC
jgi:general L-amino acid transport system permease protein